MSDNLNGVWNSFFSQRVKPLGQRFPGSYRAIVVETNDPLRMHRVRFKIPELHDWDLKPADCPWAVPSTDMGTKGCGRWSYPCIGDYIWIQFEKNHPYGPIYTGFANPTRKQYYSLPSLYGPTQLPVAADKPPEDYNLDYMPKDQRPMSHGWQDRYGNLEIHSAVGFYPVEHKEPPPPLGIDELSRGDFLASENVPQANNPDSKMMARLTKYGNLILQADMGYQWLKDGANGEFTGDFDQDNDFEIKRWIYMQRVLHEDSPTGRDQRRIMQLTRYGHKFEMRDVGWNKSRKGEWDDDQHTIGDGEDQRWIKLRTKGGMLMEACDIGFDEQDEFVGRLLIDEVGKTELLDGEDKFTDRAGNKDARFWRLVTRSGLKFVIDDRGSDTKHAQDPGRKNSELGIGVLIKGRATPGTKADNYDILSGNPVGYFWQFDEQRNYTTWGTPLGQVIEMNDGEEYMAICSRLPELPSSWKYLEDNEFLEKSVEDLDPAHSTHHLLIDHGREMIRFKTRAGTGEASRNKKLGTAATGQHAGIEVHDAPEDNPWAEFVDIDGRGLWFSRQDGIGVMRAKDGKNIYICLDDKRNNIILQNAEAGGSVKIYCQGKVDVVSGDTITLQGRQIIMNASDSITFNSGGGGASFTKDSVVLSGDLKAQNVYAYFPTAEKPTHINGKGIGQAAGGTRQPVSNLNKDGLPSKTKPDNRI